LNLFRKLYVIILFFPLATCSDPWENSVSDSDFNLNSNELQQLKYIVNKKNFSNDSINLIIRSIPNDSLRTKLTFDFVYHFYKLNDSVNFHFWSEKALELSYISNDSLRIGEAHWDLGNFYFRRNSYDKSYFNYSKAHKFYTLLGEDLLAGRMLLNLATIERNIKDYVGSEVTTIKAIQLIKPLNEKRPLYMAYNNLGIIYNELAIYEKSYEFHLKALQYIDNPELNLDYASSLNNMGVALKNSGRFKEANYNFNAALRLDSLSHKSPVIYAMLLDNLAHSRMLAKEELPVLSLFLEALNIREKVNNKAGITVNKIHLAEFYLEKKDTLKAISYAVQAKELSEEIRNYRDLLESRILLAKIDHKNSLAHLKEYIVVNDSLQRNERAVRNKFARIRFETNEFIAQNQQLTEQKRWLIGGSSGALLLSFLGIIIFRQKARNRKLKNERDQQKANEEIYKLLLDQENKIESSKLKEKERISKELHDGVLSKLFGIRFNLNHLNSKYDDHSIQTKEEYLEQLHRIENEIRLISHDLQKSQFEEVGFLKLLRKLLEEQTVTLGFSPILKADPEIAWERISNPVKMNLYRIVQEALQNIRKHSEATEAIIEFDNNPGFLHITIKDNGKGFELEKKERGIGLTNMRSRTKEIGGSYDIASSGFGTLITIKISI
jgi:two-component system, NarL family, sensor kinase